MFRVSLYSHTAFAVGVSAVGHWGHRSSMLSSLDSTLLINGTLIWHVFGSNV